MSKYCLNCKKQKEKYLRYCPVCMEKLVFTYSRQKILKKLEKELEETSKSILEINEKIHVLETKLQKANNHDAIIDLKFKITILREKTLPLENTASSLRGKISDEEKRKREELNEIKNLENIYMSVYMELTDDKIKLLQNNKLFKNKSKEQILSYFMDNYDDVEEILNQINNMTSPSNSLDILFKELYLIVDDEILEGLCDYFSLKPASKEEILKELIEKYSRHSIFDAIEVIKTQIAQEEARRAFYKMLMRILDDRDISLFCGYFNIKNPSKHKIVSFLVDNYTKDEIDLLKIELHNQADQKDMEEEFFKYIDSCLSDDEIKLLADEFSIKSHRRPQVIEYLVKNLTWDEFDSKIEEIRLRNDQPDDGILSGSNSKSDKDERKLMDIVLENLKMGNTYDEASEKANISPNLISKWRKKGMNKVSENTIYFYNELRKIESNKNSFPTVQYSQKKSRKKKTKNNLNSGKRYVNPPKVKTDNIEKVYRKTGNSRKDMKSIILLMKEGYDRKQAAEKLGIEYDLVDEWYKKGFKNRDMLSRNFFKQVREIESENKQNDASKIKPFKPVSKLPNGSKSKDKERISNSINVKKDMDRVLSFMKKGYNRIQASRKSNVNIGQIKSWYDQGFKNHDETTVYFYNEVKKIESNK